jgi:hypothetical protein
MRDCNLKHTAGFYDSLLPVLFLLLASGAFVISARAADVTFFGMIKSMPYEQTNQPAPQLLATNAFGFNAFAVGVTNGSILSASVKPSNATPVRQLLPDEFNLIWRFEERFQTQSAMDAVYPAGSVFSPVNYSYTSEGANDGVKTASLNFYILFIPISYPPTPQITNLASAQTIDNTRNFELKWNSLGGSELSLVQLLIVDRSSNVVFLSPLPFTPGALDGTSLGAVIPANTLPGDEELIGHLAVGNPGLPNTNSYPGAVGIPSLGKDTEFRIKTRPSPAPPVVEIRSVMPMELLISGESDRLYQVEASEDLKDWTNVGSFFGSAMPTSFRDDAPPAARRFYRIRVGD